MSRKLREALSKKEELRGKALALVEERKLDEAMTVKDEMKELEKEINLLRDLEDEDEEHRSTEPTSGAKKIETGGSEERSLEERYNDVYLKALRNKNISMDERSIAHEYGQEHRALTEGTGEDGGVLVPVDQQTKINELKRTDDDLSQYVNVEPVTTLSGSRVVEKLADMVPFQDLDAEGNIKKTDNPKFKTVAYTVAQKYGILPISNTLKKAGDKTLTSYVNKWLAKKKRATHNAGILAKLATLTKKAITTFDDIKKIFNVDLDPAITASSIVLTNQDGFNHLDTMKDTDGKYIMQPDPKDATKMQIKGRRVVMISNKVLKTTGTTTKKAPVIIGDLKEAITLFDFETMELLSTNVGGDAFTRNTTDTRAILGFDTQMVDDGAAIYGEITLA